MPNHVTTTCTASQANGTSPASLLPTHPRSAASTRPAPPRSTTHASSLVPPAGLPAGGTTPLSPAPVYKLEGSQFVRSLPAPSPGALVRGIKRRLPLGHDGAVGRPATLRRTASAAEIRDTVRALFEGTGQPRGPRSPPADGCAATRSTEEPAPAEPSPPARAAAVVLAQWRDAQGVPAAAGGVGAGGAAAGAASGAASGSADASVRREQPHCEGRAQPEQEQRGLKRGRGGGYGRRARKSHPNALCIAPTRELAMQIHTEACKFGNPMKLRAVARFGGQPKRSQIAYLRRTACLPGGGVHLVVATPGRLNDLLGDKQTAVVERAARDETLLHLALAFDQMPTEQRKAIELHYLQELPISEVANQMEKSLTAVGGLLHRGLKQLRKLLASDISKNKLVP